MAVAQREDGSYAVRLSAKAASENPDLPALRKLVPGNNYFGIVTGVRDRAIFLRLQAGANAKTMSYRTREMPCKNDKYMDTASLRRYCNAQIDYANGEYKNAHRNASSLKFMHLSVEQDAAILASVEQIEAQYEAYMEQERIRQQVEFERSIRSGVPFVGMPESRIADTSLGTPSSKVRHNNQVKSDEIYRCNLYDFYIKGHLIFTARCMEGKVIQVWDSRNKVDASIPYPSSPSHSSSAHSNSGSDPYHAADYSDEEDFYEDHWDDFFDFEDAEDYWREYHG